MVCNLEVLLDSQLLITEQLAVMVRRYLHNFVLGTSCAPSLIERLLSATHALVISCIEYCNELHMEPPLKSIQKLQLMQNVTT